MQGIREYNKKITSLKNTKKMTKTMKMVAASKFKRAYKAQSSALVYSRELTGLMNRVGSLGSLDEESTHPLMVKPKTMENVLILLVTSDKGLCGGFNNNLIRFVKNWISMNEGHYKFIDFSFCGKRGFSAMRKSVSVNKNYDDIVSKPDFLRVTTIGQDLMQAYTNKKYDEVYIAYNHFNNPLSQSPVMERLIPFDSAAIKKDPVSSKSIDYEFEPKSSELYNLLIPKYINFKIYFSLLENAAGEHGSRMTAMDKATENTGELIDKYILRRNRARQAAITTELIEIISGAEALNN